MKRLRRNPDESDPETNPDPDGEGSFSKDQHERKCGLSSMKMMGFFVVALMVVSVVFSVSIVLQDPPSDGVLESGKNVRFLDVMESSKEEQVLEVQPQKKADERIGIQIRVFDTGTGPFQHVLDQIIACTLKENLLPDISTEKPIINQSQKSKAVLVTSLSGGYFERLRDMYWEHPTVTGEVIGFYQPSHEEYQQTEKQFHNRKAWAEMYLLSLTDVLITSSWSTFGYVAQSLGGLKPWILYKPENRTAPDPPCGRVMSMEPCFHAPPFYDCKAKRGIDTGAVVPHVRHCEDMSWGLKLVDNGSELKA
ncbi:hypothetical protein GOBAR_AA30830 [Gossypium barbadense]|uniref:Fucosyltransferase n=1 Tax=Gossypium barbadense TaxID=3634 RepID=A0A2P5WFI8_GOSBA|nr:hypothetical protein GOBAR_AA30830 [Gossypium barbadense]